MSATHFSPSVAIPSWALWMGRVLSGLAILFMLFDSIIKLLQLDVVLQSFTQLGYPTKVAFAIGLIELICTVLYAIPRTAVLGAILLTAVMGGGIASHIRLEDPLFSHTLFGVYLGLFVWGGLWFRDAQLRRLLPLAHQWRVEAQNQL